MVTKVHSASIHKHQNQSLDLEEGKSLREIVQNLNQNPDFDWDKPNQKGEHLDTLLLQRLIQSKMTSDFNLLYPLLRETGAKIRDFSLAQAIVNFALIKANGEDFHRARLLEILIDQNSCSPDENHILAREIQNAIIGFSTDFQLERVRLVLKLLEERELLRATPEMLNTFLNRFSLNRSLNLSAWEKIYEMLLLHLPDVNAARTLIFEQIPQRLSFLDLFQRLVHEKGLDLREPLQGAPCVFQMRVDDGKRLDPDNFQTTKLHLAAQNGDLVTAKNALSEPYALYLLDKKGETPFHLAVSRGDEKMVKLFLTHLHEGYLPLNLKGETPLLTAVLEDNEKLVEMMAQDEILFSPKATDHLREALVAGKTAYGETLLALESRAKSHRVSVSQYHGMLWNLMEKGQWDSICWLQNHGLVMSTENMRIALQRLSRNEDLTFALQAGKKLLQNCRELSDGGYLIQQVGYTQHGDQFIPLLIQSGKLPISPSLLGNFVHVAYDDWALESMEILLEQMRDCEFNCSQALQTLIKNKQFRLAQLMVENLPYDRLRTRTQGEIFQEVFETGDVNLLGALIDRVPEAKMEKYLSSKRVLFHQDWVTWMVREGRLEEDFLLKKAEQFLTQDPNFAKKSVLQGAVSRGDVSLVAFLLSHLQDARLPLEFNNRPLMKAIEMGHQELIELLTAEPFHCENSQGAYLGCALKLGNVKNASRILAFEERSPTCEIKWEDLFSKVIKSGKIASIFWVLDRGVQLTPQAFKAILSDLIENSDDVETLKYLLERREQFVKGDDREIHQVLTGLLKLALEKRYVPSKAVEILIDNGASCRGFGELLIKCRKSAIKAALRQQKDIFRSVVPHHISYYSGRDSVSDVLLHHASEELGIEYDEIHRFASRLNDKSAFALMLYRATLEKGDPESIFGSSFPDLETKREECEIFAHWARRLNLSLPRLFVDLAKEKNASGMTKLLDYFPFEELEDPASPILPKLFPIKNVLSRYYDGKPKEFERTLFIKALKMMPPKHWERYLSDRSLGLMEKIYATNDFELFEEAFQYFPNEALLAHLSDPKTLFVAPWCRYAVQKGLISEDLFLERVQVFINAHPHLISKRLSNGLTPLHCAVEMQNKGLLHLLLGSLKDGLLPLDKKGRTPLYSAIANEKWDFVEVLTAPHLHYDACDPDSVEVLQHLTLPQLQGHELRKSVVRFEARSRVSMTRVFRIQPQLLHEVFEQLPPETLKSYLNTKKVVLEEEWLHLCVSDGLLSEERVLEKVKGFLDHEPESIYEKISVNMTPIHMALSYGNLELAKLMIGYIQERRLPTNQLGETPLVVAFTKNQREIIDLLLDGSYWYEQQKGTLQLTAALKHSTELTDFDRTLALDMRSAKGTSTINAKGSFWNKSLREALYGRRIVAARWLLDLGVPLEGSELSLEHLHTSLPMFHLLLSSQIDLRGEKLFQKLCSALQLRDKRLSRLLLENDAQHVEEYGAHHTPWGHHDLKSILQREGFIPLFFQHVNKPFLYLDLQSKASVTIEFLQEALEVRLGFTPEEAQDYRQRVTDLLEGAKLEFIESCFYKPLFLGEANTDQAEKLVHFLEQLLPTLEEDKKADYYQEFFFHILAKFRPDLLQGETELEALLNCWNLLKTEEEHALFFNALQCQYPIEHIQRAMLGSRFYSKLDEMTTDEDILNALAYIEIARVQRGKAYACELYQKRYDSEKIQEGALRALSGLAVPVDDHFMHLLDEQMRSPQTSPTMKARILELFWAIDQDPDDIRLQSYLEDCLEQDLSGELLERTLDLAGSLRCDPSRVVPQLLELSHHPEKEIRIRAAFALSRIRDEEALMRALEIVQSSDWDGYDTLYRDEDLGHKGHWLLWVRRPEFQDNRSSMVTRLLDQLARVKNVEIREDLKIESDSIDLFLDKYPDLQRLAHNIRDLTGHARYSKIPIYLPKGHLLRGVKARKGEALLYESLRDIVRHGSTKADLSAFGETYYNATWCKIGHIFGTHVEDVAKYYGMYKEQDVIGAMITFDSTFFNEEYLKGYGRIEKEASINTILYRGLPWHSIDKVYLPPQFEADFRALSGDGPVEEIQLTTKTFEGLSKEELEEMRFYLKRVVPKKVMGVTVEETRVIDRFVFADQPDWEKLTDDDIVKKSVKRHLQREAVKELLPKEAYMMQDEILEDFKDEEFAKVIPRMVDLFKPGVNNRGLIETLNVDAIPRTVMLRTHIRKIARLAALYKGGDLTQLHAKRCLHRASPGDIRLIEALLNHTTYEDFIASEGFAVCSQEEYQGIANLLF